MSSRRARAQEISDRAEAELVEQRYRFLLTASTMLSAAMDSGATIEALGRAAVPALAEVCLIDLASSGAQLARVGARATEVEVGAALEGVDPDPESDHPAIRAVESGDAVLIPYATDAELEVIAGSPENSKLLKDRGLRWCLSAPIVARSSMGALTLLTRPAAGDPFHEALPALAEDLARRAAMALDNAKLFESSRDMAVTLQRSLMPAALPSIAGLDIAARYLAGGEGAEVGGDFYDVFPTGEAAEGWAAVIGDVCGKGAEAAALSALARHTIRAANVNLKKPRRILAFLNQLVIQGGYSERFITVAYCRMRPLGKAIQVTLGRAGHPPPLLLQADGKVRAVGRPGTLIGVIPDPKLQDYVFQVMPGEALVLYTDGLTEAIGHPGRYGQSRLETELAECAGMYAEQIAAHLERSVLEFQTSVSHDDMALLVIRVDPESDFAG